MGARAASYVRPMAETSMGRRAFVVGEPKAAFEVIAHHFG